MPRKKKPAAQKPRSTFTIKKKLKDLKTKRARTKRITKMKAFVTDLKSNQVGSAAPRLRKARRNKALYFLSPEVKKILAPLPEKIRIEAENTFADDTTTRWKAVSNLWAHISSYGKKRTKEALAVRKTTVFIEERLKDARFQVRNEAVHALQALNAKQALPKLWKMAKKEENGLVRLEALRAIEYLQQLVPKRERKTIEF